MSITKIEIDSVCEIKSSSKDEMKKITEEFIEREGLNSYTTTIQNSPELIEAYTKATNYLKDTAKISERLYCIINGEESRYCKQCKKEICNFLSYQKGYRKTCSYECSNRYRYNNKEENENEVEQDGGSITKGVCKICGKRYNQLPMHVKSDHYGMSWGDYCRNYSLLPEEDFVMCEICKKYHIGSISSHIKNKHKISKKEYLEKYPNASMISEGERKKRSIRTKGENNGMFSAKTKTNSLILDRTNVMSIVKKVKEEMEAGGNTTVSFDLIYVKDHYILKP